MTGDGSEESPGSGLAAGPEPERVSLFDHALRLHLINPDCCLPDDGALYPDSISGAPDARDVPNRRRRTGARSAATAQRSCETTELTFPERIAALTAALWDFSQASNSFPSPSPEDLRQLHNRCTSLAAAERDAKTALLRASPGIPLSPRLRSAALWLVRHGVDRHAVIVGLDLLASGAGVPDDGPLIRMIGLLDAAAHAAIDALVAIPGTGHDLLWLVQRSKPDLLNNSQMSAAVKFLATDPDPAVRDWIFYNPPKPPGYLSLHVAESVGLAGLLAGSDVNGALWDRAAQLLIAMTRSYARTIFGYTQAAQAYEHWIEAAKDRTANPRRALRLARLALDLAAGPAAVVVPGRTRKVLIDRIDALLGSGSWRDLLHEAVRHGDPAVSRGAAWVLQSMAQVRLPEGRFAIRILADAPGSHDGTVETSILIDGLPVVARLRRGRAADPDDLLANGALRATAERRQVDLNEGFMIRKLSVTIVREGQEVVWTDWHSTAGGQFPNEVRFDADEYDREVERAEHDWSWEWPARTAARLVREQLSAQPGILGRWGCALDWAASVGVNDDDAELCFSCPALRKVPDTPFVQYHRVIPVQGLGAQAAAERAVAALRDADPRADSEEVGGVFPDTANRVAIVTRDAGGVRSTMFYQLRVAAQPTDTPPE